MINWLFNLSRKGHKEVYAIDPRAIANSFIKIYYEDKSDYELTAWRLNALVYLAHCWYWGHDEKPLIKGDIEAWRESPVVMNLQGTLMGRKTIGTYLYTSGGKKYEDERIDDEIIEFLHGIYNVYAINNDNKLQNIMCHHNSPYAIALFREGGGAYSNIYDTFIRDCYVEKVRVMKEEDEAEEAEAKVEEVKKELIKNIGENDNAIKDDMGGMKL